MKRFALYWPIVCSLALAGCGSAPPVSPRPVAGDRISFVFVAPEKWKVGEKNLFNFQLVAKNDDAKIKPRKLLSLEVTEIISLKATAEFTVELPGEPSTVLPPVEMEIERSC